MREHGHNEEIKMEIKIEWLEHLKSPTESLILPMPKN